MLVKGERCRQQRKVLASRTSERCVTWHRANEDQAEWSNSTGLGTFTVEPAIHATEERELGASSEISTPAKAKSFEYWLELEEESRWQ